MAVNFVFCNLKGAVKILLLMLTSQNKSDVSHCKKLHDISRLIILFSEESQGL